MCRTYSQRWVWILFLLLTSSESLGQPLCFFERVSYMTIEGLPYRVAGRIGTEWGRGEPSRDASWIGTTCESWHWAKRSTAFSTPSKKTPYTPPLSIREASSQNTLTSISFVNSDTPPTPLVTITTTSYPSPKNSRRKSLESGQVAFKTCLTLDLICHCL